MREDRSKGGVQRIRRNKKEKNVIRSSLFRTQLNDRFGWTTNIGIRMGRMTRLFILRGPRSLA